MTAIVLACISAFLFGVMSIGLRIGLSRHEDANLAALATVGGALLVAVVPAAVESPSRGIHASAAWPFVLAGLLSPGAAQLFVTRAVREAGAARASVVLGAAPLVAVTIALIALDEPLRAPLVIGAVLIAGGGFELAGERGRPEHVRRIGLLFAFVATVLFSARDNLLRWLAVDTSVPAGVAAVASLLGGLVLLALVLGPRVRRPTLQHTLPFLGVGIAFGMSYVALYEAYYRGRVTVVSPLVATESLWGVVLSVVFLRHTEVVGRRLVAGALLIVAGGALIGAFR